MKIFLCDFDDTLSCSSWITEAIDKDKGSIVEDEVRFDKFRREVQAETKNLEGVAIEVLQRAMKSGKTFIVSNAETVWLSFILKSFFPRLCSFIKQTNLTVVSAREHCQIANKNPSTDPVFWKIQCFSSIFKTATAECALGEEVHLISLGDGAHERIACKVIATTENIPYTSVKFIDNPTPLSLWYQLSLVIKNFDFVASLPAAVAEEAAERSPSCATESKEGPTTPTSSSSHPMSQGAFTPAGEEKDGDATSPSASRASKAGTSGSSALSSAYHDLMIQYSNDGFISLYHCVEEALVNETEAQLLRSQGVSSESILHLLSSKKKIATTVAAANPSPPALTK